MPKGISHSRWETFRRSDAAASFRLALEREKRHRAMFQEALKSVKQMKVSALMITATIPNEQ
jgi:rubrerythrin